MIILGSGPNRIGQGIEFDYCCVHAAQAVRDAGYEAMMVNCNPETVSTDYDTSDRLYFEPLTLEHVLNIVAREQPLKGVIVQFGGQTPLNLTAALVAHGVPILGTSPDCDCHRRGSRAVSARCWTNWKSPARRMAWRNRPKKRGRSPREVGYPVMVRPSYVLGGRAMAIVYDETRAGPATWKRRWPPCRARPILIDHYLEDAYEVDVDAIARRRRRW